MIFDVHTHITYKNHPGLSRTMSEKLEAFTADDLLREMDADGIDKSLVLPLSNPENSLCLGVAGNSETIAECAKHPDRLVAFCNIDPRDMYCTPKADLGKLMRYFKEIGCRGIGEICANIPLSSPLYRNLFHHAQNEKMPMLFHFTNTRRGSYGAYDKIHLPALDKLLDEFPETIVIGHAPSFWNEIDGELKEKDRNGYPNGPIKEEGYLFRLFEKHPNLYGDISAGSGFNALSRDKAVGIKFLKKFNRQLFFGTDRFRPQHGRTPPIIPFMKKAFESGKLSRKEYDNIMFLNFKTIILGEKQ